MKVLSDIAELYSKSLNDHGMNPKSVGWQDNASQELRFIKLLEVVDPKEMVDGIYVNDLGCGYGAMFQYLDKSESIRLRGYNGYDICGDMLRKAKEYIKDKRAVFFNNDFIRERAYYSFASGTFHVKMDVNDEEWTEYIKKMLFNMASMSTKGFAFNALSTYVDWKQDNLYYANPCFYFDFCCV